MTLKKRIQSPTPGFFKKIRKWGIITAALGGALITAPIGLPAFLVSFGGYLTVAGAVATAVSQAATADDIDPKP